MNPILELDRSLFAKVNLDWTNSFFDWFFPMITDFHKDPRIFAILVPLIVFWIWKEKMRAFKWILVTCICIGLTDIVAYRLIKASVERNRPPDAGITLQLRTDRFGGSSFPSNHAANMFAAATALSGGLPAFAPLFYLCAILIAYSRVYVGVHFPLDVIGGAILGITIAGTMRRFLSSWINRVPRRS